MIDPKLYKIKSMIWGQIFFLALIFLFINTSSVLHHIVSCGILYTLFIVLVFISSHTSFSFIKAALNSGCCRHACTHAEVFHGPNDINRFFCSKSCNKITLMLHISLALVQLAKFVQICRNSSSFPCFTDQISTAYVNSPAISFSPNQQFHFPHIGL